MRTPHLHIAYAPRAGLRCALAYVETGRDVYGWFLGPGRGGALQSAYFVLEDFHSARETRYVEVAEPDLHTGWTTDEALCHELAHLQDACAHEWLAFRGDEAAAGQFEAYARAELAAGEVAPRFERLERLDRRDAAWTFWSPGFERGVLDFLRARWPLDYGREDSPPA